MNFERLYGAILYLELGLGMLSIIHKYLMFNRKNK